MKMNFWSAGMTAVMASTIALGTVPAAEAQPNHQQAADGKPTSVPDAGNKGIDWQKLHNWSLVNFVTVQNASNRTFDVYSDVPSDKKGEARKHNITDFDKKIHVTLGPGRKTPDFLDTDLIKVPDGKSIHIYYIQNYPPDGTYASTPAIEDRGVCPSGSYLRTSGRLWGQLSNEGNNYSFTWTQPFSYDSYSSVTCKSAAEADGILHKVGYNLKADSFINESQDTARAVASNLSSFLDRKRQPKQSRAPHYGL